MVSVMTYLRFIVLIIMLATYTSYNGFITGDNSNVLDKNGGVDIKLEQLNLVVFMAMVYQWWWSWCTCGGDNFLMVVILVVMS